jgi:hypothetical protein
VTAVQAKKEKGRLGSLLVKRLLGRILIDGRFVTKKDLDRSLALQKETNRQLGEVLVGMGVLDARDLEAVLSIQKDLANPQDAVKLAAGTRQMLGELLLEARYISRRDLESVLREQKETGGKIGELLVQHELITRKELKTILDFQKRQSTARPEEAKLRLGELLVSTGQVTRSELDDALQKQKQSKKKLGEILVDAGYVKPQQIDRVLTLQRKLVTAALVASLSLAGAAIPTKAHSTGQTQTKGSSAKIMVTARVLPHVKLKIIKQSDKLVITNADIVRGYVDVPTASRIEVNNNNPSGCLIVFEGFGGPMNFIKGVHVKGGGRDVYIESAGWVTQPFARTPVSIDLSYRFVLAKDAQPGTYAWPLNISARPV